LAGRTLGIVGLGRVGRAVAERALAMQMRVVAYDPFLGPDAALDGRVKLERELDAVLAEADILTLHVPLTDETRNLINAARLARMKPGALLVNCARGGLIDEAAVAGALERGHLGGAAIDVFSEEPPKGCPLMGCMHAVFTPHLGASTTEAQTAVSTEAVDSLLDYLRSGTIRGSVNVSGLPSHLSPRDRAYLDLTARMAALLSPLCAGGVEQVEVTTHGEGLVTLAPTLALQAVAEMMSPHIEGRVNLVNAETFVRQRGIGLRHTAHSESRDHHEVVSVSFEHRGEHHAVEGAVFVDGRPRVLAIDGYHMEITPEGLLVLIFNDDRPGVIGLVGTLLGDRGINIADMVLSRRAKTALMLLKIDGEAPGEVLEALRGAEPILSVRAVRLPPLAPARD
jgi:D-3-phosphoglycerate dehydrogenase